jgi:tRNA-specific 2-thiouridylase
VARVLVMMSGGVDSSVAAALLQEQGHDVTGVTLKLWGGESDSGCCSVADVEDARRVAAQLGVPHYVFNFTDDFDANVVDTYVDAYANGRTPNPCIECNRTMKFGRLLERAMQLGYDAVATGHHARIVDTPDGPRLARGADAGKDQSYVLYMLDAAQLARTLLPVGEMTKADVRAHAARLGLRTAVKPESMDVCFITRGGREQFLAARTEMHDGDVVATDGRVLGRHDGVETFTIGQRRGVGVALGERLYVVDIDAPSATVTLGSRDELLRDEVVLDACSWAGGHAPAPDARVSVQCRAHGAAVDATVDATVDGGTVRFVTPQPRVAPGQAVVVYDGDVVLGGGTAR